MPFVPFVSAPVVKRKVDCVTHEGKKYCEDKNLTTKEAGIVILVAIFLMGWISFIMHKGSYNDWPGYAVFAGIAAPFVLLAMERADQAAKARTIPTTRQNWLLEAILEKLEREANS